MEVLSITKEKVLEAASKCSTAKEILKTIFPEVFDGQVTVPADVDIRSVEGFRMIEKRSGCNCFWLSDKFDWNISPASGGGFDLTFSNNRKNQCDGLR